MNLPSLPRLLVTPLVPMGAVLALASLTSLAQGAPIQGNGGEKGAHEEDVDYRRITANFARKTAKLPETLAATPRLSLDPAAVVAVVGTDPMTLTDWVSSETRWVPYRGILRGPVGVLMDRRGNTAHRALLLMELFHAAGHTPTLHRGSLDERTAAALFASLFTVDPGGTDLGAARERASLLEVKEWLPRIVVQGRLFEDKSFRADGSLNDSLQKRQGRAVENAAGLLAGLGSGGGKTSGEALGMGPDRWGQSSAETLVQLQLAAIFIEMFRCSRQPRAERPQCLAGAICAYVGLAVGVLSMNPIAGFGAGTLCTYATR